MLIKKDNITQYLASKGGTPLWKHSELLFEKKQLVAPLQQLLAFRKQHFYIRDERLTSVDWTLKI